MGKYALPDTEPRIVADLLAQRRRIPQGIPATQPRWQRDRFPAVSGTLGAGASTVTLSFVPEQGSLYVFKNKLQLDENTDYTLVNATVTFTTALVAGDFVDCRYAHFNAIATAPAPTIVGTNQQGHAVNNANFTVTHASGTPVLGDRVLILITTDNGVCTAVSAGLTEMVSRSIGTGRFQIFTKIAGASEPAGGYVFNFPGNDNLQTGIVAVRGAEATISFATQDTTVAATSLPVPALTTTFRHLILWLGNVRLVNNGAKITNSFTLTRGTLLSSGLVGRYCTAIAQGPTAGADTEAANTLFTPTLNQVNDPETFTGTGVTTTVALRY